MSNVIKNKNYDSIVRRSSFLLTSWKGGLEALEKFDYIFQYPTETDDAYLVRRQRAAIYNYFRPIVNQYTFAIYKKQIERPIEKKNDIFKLFIKSATPDGKSFNDVMKRASILSTFLRVGILVDAEPVFDADGYIVSKVEKERKLAERLIPYVNIILPENILDWYFDKRGLAWVKICEKVQDKTDPFNVGKVETRYLIFTRDVWFEGYDKEKIEVETLPNNSNSKKEAIEWSEPIPHTLGEVPFRFIFQSDIDNNQEWETTVEEIALSQRRINNWLSALDENIHSTAHSAIAVPIGDHYEEIVKELKSPSTGKKIIPYEAGSQPPSFLRDNLINIPALLAAVEKEINEVYRMAGITVQDASHFADQSGISKEMDFYQFHAAIIDKAEKLENLENWILSIVAKYESIDFKESDESIYPHEFEIVDDMKQLEKDMNAVASRISETFTKYSQKQFVIHTYPSIDPKTLKQIEKEIEEGKDVDVEKIVADELERERQKQEAEIASQKQDKTETEDQDSDEDNQ